MKKDFNEQEKIKNKVILGEEKFESNSELEEKIYDRDQQEKLSPLVTPEEADIKKPAEKKKKSGGKIKFLAGVIVILLLLIFFAETLRTAIFRSKDSLIFLPKDGVFMLQIGVILIALGILTIGVAFVSLFNKKGKLTKKQKGLTILVGLLLAFFGVSTFFRYVDFKETTIIDKTILTIRAYPYLDVNEVDASTYSVGEENQLKYTYKLQDGKKYEVNVTEKNMDAVRKIDQKIKGTAKRSIDNYAIQEMERLKMYSKDEALKLFILE